MLMPLTLAYGMLASRLVMPQSSTRAAACQTCFVITLLPRSRVGFQAHVDNGAEKFKLANILHLVVHFSFGAGEVWAGHHPAGPVSFVNRDFQGAVHPRWRRDFLCRRDMIPVHLF